MTMRRATLATLALVAVAACGRKGARSSDFDSATAAALAAGNNSATAAANLPKIGHILSANMAHRLDRKNMVYGGTTDQFYPADSVLFSISTIYVPAGAAIDVRVRSGNKTVDSASTKSVAADSTGNSAVSVGFAPPGKAWPLGTYEAQISLDGKFQLSRTFTVKTQP